ncbi:MAG: DUF2911 domain-containing protein [Vicinamibacteria bacterium]|nr:DUF2911 domain-containing protein [Vicinamibacteria bacterium]
MRKAMAFLVMAGVLAAAPAMASGKGSIRVDVNSDTAVAGQKLPAGTYTISWKSEGETTKVVFKSGRTKIEAQAKLEQREAASDYDAVVSRGANGSKAVAEVRVEGKKDVLVFDSQS